MVTVVQVSTDDHIHKTQELFVEYFDFLRSDVDKVDDLDDMPPLAGYQEEIASLPGRYGLPDGRLLLAFDETEVAGCVAFYQLDEGVCEVKRLWVRPNFRGKKIDRILVETLIEEARQIGYATIVLSTVDVLKEAIGLYQSFGFEVNEPFYEMPEEMLAHEIFMRLDLSSS
jgi:putative acetyltransferase